MAIDGCMKLLWRMTTSIATGSTPWLRKLLERGFLRALVLITIQCVRQQWRIEFHVRLHLCLGLPAGLVYYHAAVAYRNSLAAVQELISSDDFKKSPLFESWGKVWDSANECLDVLDEYESEFFESWRACDNLECSNIRDAHDMAGRCSRCQAFYYCSPECQITDWEIAHRDTCSSYERILLCERATRPQTLMFRERSFLRALIHQKYDRERRNICAQQVRLLASYPSEDKSKKNIFTFFDYCNCPPVIYIYAIHPSDAHARTRLAQMVNWDLDSAEWHNLVQRAQDDEGYMHLHAMRILEGGGGGRVWVIPLRTDDPGIHVGVVELAKRVRGGELAGQEDLLREIDDLLEEEADVLEIH
ncbi:hypothetical protein FB45DRAFT_1062478 [Roridomyces roridus]|uniref:MYND-type domain-containing protein n=1 Tax=Roridomyces roridus TaxID=1738132 RepID=A0AAD7FF00_9AGAR|nr:hypothetical protein FB45DRAFT_1062478 [Roridomyces roridus]